jgi:hypothetical protein
MVFTDSGPQCAGSCAANKNDYLQIVIVYIIINIVRIGKACQKLDSEIIMPGMNVA